VAGTYTLTWGWNGHPDDPDPELVTPDWYQVIDADEHEVDIDLDASELVAEVLRRDRRNRLGELLEIARSLTEQQSTNTTPASGGFSGKGDSPTTEPMRLAERVTALEGEVATTVEAVRGLTRLVGQLPTTLWQSKRPTEKE
jgi:hypothetical protein